MSGISYVAVLLWAEPDTDYVSLPITDAFLIPPDGRTIEYKDTYSGKSVLFRYHWTDENGRFVFTETKLVAVPTWKYFA